MIKIDLFGNQPLDHFTAYQKPKYIECVKDGTGVIEAYVDLAIPQVLSSKTDKPKIAILLESGGHYKQLHDNLKDYYNKFKYVFTFDADLLKLPNAKPSIFGGVYEFSDVEKTKSISFCCSNKRIIPSHLERIKLADQIKDKVDMKGDYLGSRRATTSEIFKDYKFNVVFECENTPYYFTEKLCNCFANKCVPINYGCTDLAKFGFDTSGVIQIDNIQQIIDLVNSNVDGDAEYNKRKDAIEYNYKVVDKYKCLEDGLYETYRDLFEELINDKG